MAMAALRRWCPPASPSCTGPPGCVKPSSAGAGSRGTCGGRHAVSHAEWALQQGTAPTRLQLRSCALQHRRSLLRLLRRHARHARLDDARLFAGDEGQRVAQHLHVVVAQRSYTAHRRRRHHIGRVPSPAQPNLHDGHVHALLVEDTKR